MRILFTNNTLDWHAGTEIYVRDVAIALQRRGHRPVAYSAQLGAVAEELRAASVPVVDRLTGLGEPPELIHGHHHYDTLAAILRFPETPAVYFCHGSLPWQEAPLLHPRISRYVAVDEACRERLMVEGGVASGQIDVVLNYYNGKTVPPRANPLPPKPRRALAFANEFSGSRGLPALVAACRREGVELQAIGRDSGRWEARPGPLMADYDLVFAKARSAIEAMAAGAAVVLCNPDRCGPMVTTENFDGLRPWNFGIRTLTHELSEDRIVEEIRRYNPRNAAAVTARVRAECELQVVVDRLEQIYRRVLEQWRAAPPPAHAESEAATSEYLQQNALQLKQFVAIDRERKEWRQRAELAERMLAENSRRQSELQREIRELRESISWRVSQTLLSPVRWMLTRAGRDRP